MRLSPLKDSGTAGLTSVGGVTVSDVSGSLHAGPDGREDAGGDVDVADVGDVGDGARPVAEDGRDHVLGDRVLRSPDLHLATERTGRFDQPGVRHAQPG